MPPKKSLKSIIDDLQLDETHTRPTRKAKVFTKITDVVPPLPDYNFMADLLELPNTEATDDDEDPKDGYKFLLVVVDLATHEFDIEPLRKKEAPEILSAFKKMMKRKILNLPYSSIATDGGNEFMGDFAKFMKDNKIFHKRTVSGRHTQQSMVENLNRMLGRLFNGYMNKVEEETGKTYRKWDDKIDYIREALNEFRKIDNLPSKKELVDVIPSQSFVDIKPKYKVGDMVFFQLDRPQNALGYTQSTDNFREGDYRWDRFPKQITAVLYYNGKVPVRYLLEGQENVSYTEQQLKPATGFTQNQSLFRIERIIDRQNVGTKKKPIYNYKVWFKGYKKANAKFINEKSLIDDGLKDALDEYDAEHPR
jgi:hypothetical protein